MMLKPGLLPHLIFPHLVGHFDPRLALVFIACWMVYMSFKGG